MQTIREAAMQYRDFMDACRRSSPVDPESEGGQMQVQVVTAFCLGAGRDVYEGEVLTTPRDLTVAAANVKISERMVKKITPSKAVQVEAADPVVTHGDPSPETRAPRAQAHPRRRGSRKTK